ncbi:UNVERIFIED_CONTAM: hypothetical protein Slati_3478800 [Sesamum latifolium]|uniref:Uncharacterized protein n=1 Tax=Sesamum latifolium TaxID=2727402 RepID=A0AAW2UGQ7_9LAMI
MQNHTHQLTPSVGTLSSRHEFLWRTLTIQKTSRRPPRPLAALRPIGGYRNAFYVDSCRIHSCHLGTNHTATPGCGHYDRPPLRSTSSDTSTEEISPALLGAIQQIVSTVIWEQEAPPPVPKDVPPQWLAHLEYLQKGLQDVQYQIRGAPEDETQGIPFTEAVMANELPVNCRTPAIIEYDGRTDPLEHLAHFENAALLHRYTNGIKCHVFVTSFARATQQWFNQLPRFNTVALEVPSATQEVKASAFLQGLLDGDFFKSLAKKPVSKFDALLVRAAKYINMEDAQDAKKESRGEKRKEVKEEAPSKKPRNEF